MDSSLRYQTDPDVTFQRLEDATVIVHLGTGRIHHTNATGSRIWELLEAGQSMGEIIATLREEFETPAGQLEQELSGFVDKLEQEKMIRRAGAAS